MDVDGGPCWANNVLVQRARRPLEGAVRSNCHVVRGNTPEGSGLAALKLRNQLMCRALRQALAL